MVDEVHGRDPLKTKLVRNREGKLPLDKGL